MWAVYICCCSEFCQRGSQVPAARHQAGQLPRSVPLFCSLCSVLLWCMCTTGACDLLWRISQTLTLCLGRRSICSWALVASSVLALPAVLARDHTLVLNWNPHLVPLLRQMALSRSHCGHGSVYDK